MGVAWGSSGLRRPLRGNPWHEKKTGRVTVVRAEKAKNPELQASVAGGG